MTVLPCALCNRLGIVVDDYGHPDVCPACDGEGTVEVPERESWPRVIAECLLWLALVFVAVETGFVIVHWDEPQAVVNFGGE